MVQKAPIPSDRLLANESFGCSERRLMALAGVVASFLCVCSVLPMSGHGLVQQRDMLWRNACGHSLGRPVF